MPLNDEHERQISRCAMIADGYPRLGASAATHASDTFGMTKTLMLAVILAGPFLSGCGTIGGLASDGYTSKVYVGIRADVQACGETVAHGVPGWLLFIWDIPFSLVLDTLILPGTLAYEIFRSKKLE